MSIKKLRNQLFAAIIMVLVASIALGSSTYAWFVSNNQVTATTSTISAQSNAPFLKIANKKLIDDGTTWESVTTTSDKFVESNVQTLYPAQVVGEFIDTDVEVANSTAEIAQVKFQSAYASTAYSSSERENTRFTVGNPTAAVDGDYAYMESFYIGSTDLEAGSFKNLNVLNVSVDVSNTASFSSYMYDGNGDGIDDVTVTAQDAERQMLDAVRVLVVNNASGNWTVWDKNGKVESYKTTAIDAQVLNGTKMVTDSKALAETISAGSYIQIDVYVFYDGADTRIFTNNMTGLHDVNATVTFTTEFANDATQS